jgi:hypothetical protein
MAQRLGNCSRKARVENLFRNIDPEKQHNAALTIPSDLSARYRQAAYLSREVQTPGAKPT